MLVVFLFAVFPVLYNTVEGARSLKPELIEVARSFRSGEWALWREVMVPYTLPFTMTGRAPSDRPMRIRTRPSDHDHQMAAEHAGGVEILRRAS